MTWSAWVYITANPPNDGQIIAHSDGNSGWQLKITPDTGKRTFGIARLRDQQRPDTAVSAIRSYTPKTWYYVTGVLQCHGKKRSTSTLMAFWIMVDQWSSPGVSIHSSCKCHNRQTVRRVVFQGLY